MKKIITFLIVCSSFYNCLMSQNVGINTTGLAPNTSAMLDIVATDKGLLVPRFALSDITVAAPVTSPATALIVYNTFTSALATTSNNVAPGFYYWDGAKWVAFSGSGGREWALLGNAGTVAGTNFLGTTDNVDLVFKVNNVQSGRITSSTNNNTFLGYESGLNNTSTFNAFFGSQAGKANTSGGNNVGFGFGAMRNSTTGSVNVFVGNNAGANWVTSTGNTGIGNQALQGLSTSTGSYNIGLGFAAGSGYNTVGPSANGLSQLSGSYNTYIGYSSSGTTSSNTFTNSTAIGAFSQAGANDVMVLGSVNGANGATADTKVGIGITAPTEKLHVNGNIRFSNALMPNNLPGTSGQVLVSQGAGAAPIWAFSSALGQGFSQNAATACTRYVGDNSSSFVNGTSGICSSGYTTGNWFNIAGLSITRTITAGNFVSVSVHIRWKTDNYSYYAPETIWFRILRDGTEIARSSMFTQDPDWNILEGDGNIFYYDAAATAGSHTYSVQTAISNNTGGTESFWIQDGYLTLIEIK